VAVLKVKEGKYMEQLWIPESIRDRLQKNGVSLSQNFDPEEYEARKAEVLNQKSGDLTGYDCPLCLNRGYKYKAKNSYIIAVPCPCMEIRHSIRLAQKSGLSDLLERHTFDAFQTPDTWQAIAKKLAQEYAETPDGWFAASGASGSGKTHLCTAICRRLMSEGRAVHYALWRETAQSIKAVALDGEARSKLLRPMKEAEVLYFDDFLKTARGTAPTKADVELAFDIIGARYNAKALTLISTELSVDKLLSLDEALGSRIYEMCHNGAQYLSFVGEGKNWRLRADEKRAAPQ
jgi:DNA replication protein DnaC